MPHYALIRGMNMGRRDLAQWRKIIISALILISIAECVLAYPVSNEIIKVTDDDLDSAINNYPLFVLDCYQIGCSHCDSLNAALGEIIQDFQGKVVFGEMDMTDNIETKKLYAIHRFPTLLLFKNGNLVKKVNGFVSKIDTEKKIASYLSLQSPVYSNNIIFYTRIKSKFF
jgi:thioredoxin